MCIKMQQEYAIFSLLTKVFTNMFSKLFFIKDFNFNFKLLKFFETEKKLLKIATMI